MSLPFDSKSGRKRWLIPIIATLIVAINAYVNGERLQRIDGREAVSHLESLRGATVKRASKPSWNQWGCKTA